MFEGRSVPMDCLVTPVDEIAEDADQIIRNDEPVAIAPAVVSAIAEAIRQCSFYAHRRIGVDCSVFSTLLLGGTYIPVPNDAYRSQLNWRVAYGRSLTQAEAQAVPDGPEMVQFAYYSEKDGILPRHTATRLPDVPNLYIQKIGHTLPIALTSIDENIAFHGANTIFTVDELDAECHGVPVLAYTNPNPETEPFCTYQGKAG
jgi:hypothetical protein